MTISVDIAVNNPGSSPATGSVLTASTDLVSVKSVVVTNGEGLRGNRALSAAVAASVPAACAGADNPCTLPAVAPGHSTITVVFGINDGSDLRQLKSLRITIDEKQLSVPLPSLIPVLTPTYSSPATAGQFSYLTITAVYDSGVTVGNPGSLTMPGQAEGVQLTGLESGCKNNAGSVSCPPTAGSGGTFTYQFRASFLPSGSGDESIPWRLSGPGVGDFQDLVINITPRVPGGPVYLRGDYDGTSIGQATTKCLPIVGCKYSSASQDLPTPPTTAAWAELTWVGPVDPPEVGITSEEPRPFAGSGDPMSGTAMKTYSMDVTDAINAALAQQGQVSVSTIYPRGDQPTLTPELPTGWTLSVIWTTDHLANANKVELSAAKDIADYQGKYPRNILVAHEDALRPTGIGTLLLWNPERHGGPTAAQGVFCNIGPCVPQTEKHVVVDPIPGDPTSNDDGAAWFVSLQKPRSITVLGPTLVVRGYLTPR
ncbi:MAG: hypothetical protein ACR2P2_14095 [Nakamurella sp.]